MKKIKELTVAGAGVAGSYFYALFTEKFPEVKLKIYDGAKRRGCTCAFGCFYTLLREKLDKVGLNVEDYILCKNEGLVLNGVYFPLRNQISIDKPRLIKDLCPKVIKRNIYFTGRKGCLINATGIPLCRHYAIRTSQYRVKLEGLEPATNYIHVDPRYVGYAWVFSLGEEGKWFHLGAGCVNADPEILINALMKRYGIKVKKKACQCHRPIRIVNPKENLPVVGSEDLRTLIVSVGEAGGYVFPVTGEGILPSMDSVDLLVEGMNSPFWPAGYTFMTKKYLKKWNYDRAFKTWRLMLKHPRTAWLYGFRFMLNRTRKRAQPEITPPRLIKAMIKMALGGRV